MNIGILSTYPPASGGVAVYTKHLAKGLSRNGDQVFVLAQKNPQPQNDSQVLACWQTGLSFVWQINQVISQKKIDVIHIQHELHLFGLVTNFVALPGLLLLLKIRGIKSVITFHGLVPLAAVNPSFVVENGYKVPSVLARLALWFLYSVLGGLSNKIILHEPYMLASAGGYAFNQKKVSLIPHMVFDVKIPEIKSARAALGISDKYTFIYFGYVTGYKGIETIIAALKLTKSDFNFLVVASPHPRLNDRSTYKKYYQSLVDSLSADPRCRVVGYLPQEQLMTNIGAANCAVFPYTIAMASSGPMNWALAGHKLILSSNVFTGVVPEDLMFSDASGLAELMDQAIAGELDSSLNKLQKMASLRQIDLVAKDHWAVYQGN